MARVTEYEDDPAEFFKRVDFVLGRHRMRFLSEGGVVLPSEARPQTPISNQLSL